MTAALPIPSIGTLLFEQLHNTYAPNAYDNWLVWAGNLSLSVDGGHHLRRGPNYEPFARSIFGDDITEGQGTATFG